MNINWYKSACDFWFKKLKLQEISNKDSNNNRHHFFCIKLMIFRALKEDCRRNVKKYSDDQCIQFVFVCCKKFKILGNKISQRRHECKNRDKNKSFFNGISLADIKVRQNGCDRNFMNDYCPKQVVFVGNRHPLDKSMNAQTEKEHPREIFSVLVNMNVSVFRTFR